MLAGFQYIPGYERLYIVSRAGEVRALPRRGCRGGPVSLKPTRDAKGRQYGYVQACLWREGARKFEFVHRLVLVTFVGPALPGWDGCHLNDDPKDNRLENLMWGPASENRAGMKHERRELALRYIAEAEKLGLRVKISVSDLDA